MKSESEELLGYSDIPSLHFTDLSAFEEICTRHFRRLIDGIETCQYLAFRDVPKGTLDAVNTMREEGLLPGMRIMYDGSEEVLIVKIMVGVAHAVGANEFARMVEERVI